MASFKNISRDELPSATFINQLSPLKVSENKFHNSGFKAWTCAFSPDESCFAWSPGNKIIILIPWKQCKSKYLNFNPSRPSTKASVRVFVENSVDVQDCFGPGAISINTGNDVRSMAFGSFKHLKQSPYQPYWTRISTSKDFFLVSGHANGRIYVWDILAGKLILALLDHFDLVSCLSFCPSQNVMVASSSYDGTLKIWSLNGDGEMLCTLKTNGKPIFSCCWSPDTENMASVGINRSVYVWNMKTFTLKFELKGHHNNVIDCAFSPDGCLIASASFDTRLILWNAHSGEMLKCFGHLHPSPRLIYAAGENGNWIRSISFSSDGAHIASVADDGFLRFWDIANEENPESVAGIGNALCCSYSPSGGILAVGCLDGSVSFYRSSKQNVQSLLFLSRIAIRQHFPFGEIDNLHLPKQLKSYLYYKDWV